VNMGALCWAIYTALPQRHVKGLSSVQVAASTVIGGAALMVLFARLTTPDLMQWPSPTVLAAIGFMGLFGSVLAYLWWNDDVKTVGPTQAAICMNFVPLFATLIGLLRGQEVSASQWLGAALVVSGVLVSVLWKRPQPVPQTAVVLCKA